MGKGKGRKSKKEAPRGFEEKNADARGPEEEPEDDATDDEAAERVHTVGQGQRLGSIAKRYRVTLSALCHANDITRRTTIRPGQKLVIPVPSDKNGERARKRRKTLLKPVVKAKKRIWTSFGKYETSFQEAGVPAGHQPQAKMARLCFRKRQEALARGATRRLACVDPFGQNPTGKSTLGKASGQAE